jgi:methionyl-tRNA synthetase
MDAIEVRKAAAELRAIWVAGNEYLQSAAPWTAFKEDPDRAAAITRFALNLIPFYAGLSAPFIPDAAAAMADAHGRRPHLARQRRGRADRPAPGPCLHRAPSTGKSPPGSATPAVQAGPACGKNGASFASAASARRR